MNVTELLTLQSPRFKDFLRLRVGGKDSYSEMRLTALRKAVNSNAMAQVNALDLPHGEQAKIFRWHLRGLPIDLAIRKVQVDMEVGRNAAYAKEEQDFWDQDGAEDYALDMLKDGEDMNAEIHPDRGPDEVVVAGYTLHRVHANKVFIIAADGELIGEKEINNEKHWQNFLTKFSANEEYRQSIGNVKLNSK